MASVRSLGDGRWQVRVYLEIDGRPARPSKIVHARNRPQAEAKANDWLRELRSSGRQEFRPKTVADAVDVWLEACRDRGLTEGTLRENARHGQAIKEALGQRRVDQLTSRDVERYYADVRRSTGVRHRHAALRAVLNEAIHLGWTGVNVAKMTRRPKEETQRQYPPTADEVLRLIKVGYDRSEETGNFIVVSVGTGMRRGEVAAMRASRVDVEAGVYLVDTALSNLSEGGRLIVKDPKTRQVRRVPILARVAEAIVAQAQLLEGRARAAKVELVADPWLWSADADAGRPRRPDWFSKEFAACREAAGVKARLHDLRHAYATWALDAGLPLPTVSEILGHANPATTSSIYSHGVTATARQVAAAIGSMIAGELEA